MQPNLEVVDVLQHESFKVWAHGYPYRTVRWHFHPEYEIQLITETSGQYFVGDYVGRFNPGNLVFMAPNLPHNWVSEIPEGGSVERRNLILQFSSQFLFERVMAFPEFRHLHVLVSESKRGVVFSEETAQAAKTMMEALLGAKGARRIVLFLSLLDLLGQDTMRKKLASRRFSSEPSSYMSSSINQVLTYIDQNLSGDLCETDVADFARQSVTNFSRYFKKHTGMSFIQHVNSLRIHRSCELLVDTALSVTEICFQVGYNNVSNFNRHFLQQKGVPPSRFRALHQINRLSASASMNTEQMPGCL